VPIDVWPLCLGYLGDRLGEHGQRSRRGQGGAAEAVAFADILPYGRSDIAAARAGVGLVVQDVW